MSRIHPTAVVAGGCDVGGNVSIGPYCVIGEHVRLGAGCRLMAHVVVDGRTTLGEGCRVFPFACIGTQTQDLKFTGGDTFVEVGDHTTLREYVTVNSGTHDGEVTRIGSRCHIMAYAHVAHACVVGNDVIMSNCATLAGDVIVEDQAILGGLSAVHQFSRIGKLCFIGGCTAVRQDCPPFMIVSGNPAAVHGPNRVGLQRRGVDSEVQARLKHAYRLLYRENLSTRQAVDSIRRDVESCPEIDHLLEFVEASERGIIK